MSNKIFISYYRQDIPGDAHYIFDKLADAFGRENIFMDVDKINISEKFDDALDKALSQCTILISIIGPRWSTIQNNKKRKKK